VQLHTDDGDGKSGHHLEVPYQTAAAAAAPASPVHALAVEDALLSYSPALPPFNVALCDTCGQALQSPVVRLCGEVVCYTCVPHEHGNCNKCSTDAPSGGYIVVPRLCMMLSQLAPPQDERSEPDATSSAPSTSAPVPVPAGEGSVRRDIEVLAPEASLPTRMFLHTSTGRIWKLPQQVPSGNKVMKSRNLARQLHKTLSRVQEDHGISVLDFYPDHMELVLSHDAQVQCFAVHVLPYWSTRISACGLHLRGTIDFGTRDDSDTERLLIANDVCKPCRHAFCLDALSRRCVATADDGRASPYFNACEKLPLTTVSVKNAFNNRWKRLKQAVEALMKQHEIKFQ
jgi:hypothetical protein